MHESYDDEDDYDEDYYNYDYGDQYDPYKFYFQFNVDQSPLSDWLKQTIDDMINNIEDFPVKKFPVSSWNPNADKGKTYQYLGSNYQGSPIWKTQYFLIDAISLEYRSHIQQYAKHFVEQPSYYKGLFDILN
jgi:hypothetical protein